MKIMKYYRDNLRNKKNIVKRVENRLAVIDFKVKTFLHLLFTLCRFSLLNFLRFHVTLVVIFTNK